MRPSSGDAVKHKIIMVYLYIEASSVEEILAVRTHIAWGPHRWMGLPTWTSSPKFLVICRLTEFLTTDCVLHTELLSAPNILLYGLRFTLVWCRSRISLLGPLKGSKFICRTKHDENDPDKYGKIFCFIICLLRFHIVLWINDHINFNIFKYN